MNRRRFMLTSTGAGAGIVLTRALGAGIATAQTARYELKIIQEPEMSTVNGASAYFGAFNTMSNNGTIGGNLTVSDAKASPCVWTLDGKRTKLKTGEFGGNVIATSDSGLAAGYTYGVRFGDVNNSWDEDLAPAIWIDGAVADVTLPENAIGTGRIDAMNGDGIGFGWVDVHIEEYNYDSSERAFFADSTAIVPSNDVNSPSFSPIEVGKSGTMVGTTSAPLQTENGSTSYSAPALMTGNTLKALPFPADYPAPKSEGELVPTVSPIGITGDDRAIINFSKTIDAVTDSRLYIYEDGEPLEVPSGIDDLIYLNGTATSESGFVLGYANSVDRTNGSRVLVGPEETIILDMTTISNDTNVATWTLNAINDDGVICGNGYDADGQWYGIALLPI